MASVKEIRTQRPTKAIESNAKSNVEMRSSGSTAEAVGAVAVPLATKATLLALGATIPGGIIIEAALLGGAGLFMLGDAIRRKIKLHNEIKDVTFAELAIKQEARRVEKEKEIAEHKADLSRRYVPVGSTSGGVVGLAIYEPMAKISRPGIPFLVRRVKVSPFAEGEPAHVEWSFFKGRKRMVELAVQGAYRGGLPIVNSDREVGREAFKTDLTLKTYKGSRRVDLLQNDKVLDSTRVIFVGKDNIDKKLRVAAKRVRKRRSGNYTMWRMTGLGLPLPLGTLGRTV